MQQVKYEGHVVYHTCSYLHYHPSITRLSIDKDLVAASTLLMWHYCITFGQEATIYRLNALKTPLILFFVQRLTLCGGAWRHQMHIREWSSLMSYCIIRADRRWSLINILFLIIRYASLSLLMYVSLSQRMAWLGF